jgi:hypothetical protein
VIARLALTFVLVAAFAGVLAHPAAAVPLLDEGDAAELAQSLADAREEQDVCYGWNVQVLDGSGGPSGFDTGSNLGPGRPLGAAAAEPCTRSVTLEGAVEYTCESCEAEDSSAVRVVSSFPGGPTTADLEDLGLKGSALKEDTGDVTLINMVGALPLITASKGAAPPVPVEPSTVAPAASDRPTGTPSTPDWLRDAWLQLAALLVIILAGVVWFVQQRSIEATDRRMRDTRPGRGAFVRPTRPSDPTE